MLNFGDDPERTARGSFPSSAVCGLSPFVLLTVKRPCALGADATLLSFRASSSLPAVTAFSSAAEPFTGTLGVSGGEGGTLPSL